MQILFWIHEQAHPTYLPKIEAKVSFVFNFYDWNSQRFLFVRLFVENSCKMAADNINESELKDIKRLQSCTTT